VNNQQRGVLILTLCLFALGLAGYFLQFSERVPATRLPTMDEFLRPTSGPLIMTIGGADIFARLDSSESTASLFGLAIPGLLLSAAAFLWFGRKKISVDPVNSSVSVAWHSRKEPFFVPKTFNNLWAGQVPLARAFWGFYVFGAFLCLIVAMVILVPFALIHALPVGLLAAYSIMALYGFVATVGVWRSATASTPPYWPAAIVKGVIIFWTVGIMANLANGGLQHAMQNVLG